MSTNFNILLFLFTFYARCVCLNWTANLHLMLCDSTACHMHSGSCSFAWCVRCTYAISFDDRLLHTLSNVRTQWMPGSQNLHTIRKGRREHTHKTNCTIFVWVEREIWYSVHRFTFQNAKHGNGNYSNENGKEKLTRKSMWVCVCVYVRARGDSPMPNHAEQCDYLFTCIGSCWNAETHSFMGSKKEGWYRVQIL